MLQASVWGLLGCSLFLSMGHVHTFVAFFMHAWVMIALFALLVVSPWLVILYAYTTSLREIVLTHEGITMKTRWKTYQLPWLHTEAVVVAHTPSPLHQLSLWIIPKSEDLPAWQLNLKKGECVIKARGWFVHEMQRCAPKLYYSRQDCLPKRLLKTITF
jgi:hypothetical protein